MARLNLADLSNTLKEAQGIDLNFFEEAVRAVAEMGYDPVFGARPLRNVISERLKSVLAEKILKQEIKRGVTLTVGFSGGNFIFE